MGYYADQQVVSYLSGRRGIPLPKPREYPTTTREAIAGKQFSVVEVTNTSVTNRMRGTKLVVCDNTQELYWVWASSKVTGIRKDACTVIESGLALNDALARLGRKRYGQPA